MKTSLIGAVIALCATPAMAGTVYFNQADWLAALNGATPTALTLIPQTVPGGTTFYDDQISLYFDPGHHDGSTNAGGWTGDVHETGMPRLNTATFATPITAFGGFLNFELGMRMKFDETYGVQRVAPGFGGGTYLTGGQLTGSPVFFGWIANFNAVTEIEITALGHNNTYKFTDVQYVSAAAGASVVPLPAAAWMALPLLAVAGVMARRRTA